MLLGLPQVILNLLVQPAFGRSIESNRQPDSHFRTNASFTINNAGKRLSTDTKGFCRFGDCQPERLKAKLFDNIARMWRIMHKHDIASVVIFIIDNFRMLPIELKGNTPVATHSN